MATSIDNNEADEKSDKPRCQLINIRCTRYPLYHHTVSADTFQSFQLLFPLRHGSLSLFCPNIPLYHIFANDVIMKRTELICGIYRKSSYIEQNNWENRILVSKGVYERLRGHIAQNVRLCRLRRMDFLNIPAK